MWLCNTSYWLFLEAILGDRTFERAAAFQPVLGILVELDPAFRATVPPFCGVWFITRVR